MIGQCLLFCLLCLIVGALIFVAFEVGGNTRHSDILLTMNTYSHVDQQEQAAAIGKLKGVE